MKHSINLFQHDLIPEQPWLSFTRVLLATLLVCVVLVGWKGMLILQLKDLQTQVATQQEKLANEQQELAQLSEQLRAKTPSSALQAEVNQLESEVSMRQFLLAEFQRRGQIKQQDYAELLTDLAILHREGVWLTRIHQDRNRLNLHGHSVNASILPQWMQSFKTSATLSDRRFNMVELKRDNRDLLSFVLQGSSGDMAEFLPVEGNSFDEQGNSVQASQQRDREAEARAAEIRAERLRALETAEEAEQQQQEQLEEARRALERVTGGNQ
ncbi:hypothetical protein CWE08_02085 [Aliidiomarina iranensis]|uniref:MSHA biogenesis protein MshI n=1 Tax=Aliidiomarina iranensis TaxID=1434071 RepID=A0A432W2K6_9GAMM|nr:PilN domain-containing protein [Aliidiomarina iranensis]RUO23457.1 hypothetical protein CWE08_02085 [Aliidiomarina iranensis]